MALEVIRGCEIKLTSEKNVCGKDILQTKWLKLLITEMKTE